MRSRRAFGSLVGAAACDGAVAACSANAPALDLDAIPLAVHERAMRLAIAAAKANPLYPFGTVIIGAPDRAVLAQGVDTGKAIRSSTARSSRSMTRSPATATEPGPTASSTPPASPARRA